MTQRKRLRVAAATFGLPFVAGGLLADVVGFGSPGSLGFGQLALIAVGSLLALFGLLGAEQFGRAYRSASVIVINSALLFVALELIFIVAARTGILPMQGRLSSYLPQPYYQSQDWSEAFWREAAEAERYRYASYSLWRHKEYAGEFVNVDRSGVRRTPPSKCSGNAYRVVFLGGSAAWGWGAPDWGTIPSYLQREIASLTDRPVCVTNLAEDGYVSTQGLVALVRHIQEGSTPDLVISYDGVNDVISAAQTGRAGTHVDRARIAERVEDSRNPLLAWLSERRLCQFVYSWITPDQQRLSKTSMAFDSNLVADVLSVYLQNLVITKSLALSQGFDVAYVWQPHILAGQKELTVEEDRMQQQVADPLRTLYEEAYRRACQRASNGEEALYCAASAFDGESEQIWIDEWGHVTPKGNEIVARLIFSYVRDKVEAGLASREGASTG